jgi:hypothetical protein
MIKKTIFDKFINEVKKGTSPEAMEVKKIMARMIESEYVWAKEHQNEKVCSRCGRVNS